MQTGKSGSPTSAYGPNHNSTPLGMSPGKGSGVRAMVNMRHHTRRTSTITDGTVRREASQTVRLKTSTGDSNQIGKRTGSFQRQQSSNASENDGAAISPAFMRSRFSNTSKPVATSTNGGSPTPQLN